MREIDNNLNNVNFRGIPQIPSEKTDNEAAVTPAAPAVEQKEISDLKNMPELGRSQVQAPDSIENDMKILDKKPELVEELNHVIDEYAKNHTQEETVKFMDTAIQEFFAKK